MKKLFLLFLFVLGMGLPSQADAEENQIKPDPPPLQKPALSHLNTDQNQVLSELRNQAFVGTQQFAPQQDNEWVEQCLNLSLDQKKWGCKIAAYRIRWFNGNWSSWFVPGVNDLYKKDFEPLRRFWACFNDHAFEIIYMADQKIDFSKIKKKRLNRIEYRPSLWYDAA